MQYTPLDRVQARYDVIVVGSGLGGLTSANRLAAAGHSVLLLEHHIQLGGLATWFKRGGHIFDVSLHGFPYGMVKTCKKYWGKAIRDSIVQLNNIVFDNPQFSLTTTFSKNDFIRILQERFGVHQTVVEGFFATVDVMNFYDDQSLTTRELFEQFFPGRSDIHRLLMEPITYANGSTLDEPAITYGIVFSNFMNRGVFTFEGGTDKLIGLMADELRDKGVDICTGARVERILIENGITAGVVVRGREIKAKAVISNAGVTNTIDNLVGREQFAANFLDRSVRCGSITPAARSISAFAKARPSAISATCCSPRRQQNFPRRRCGEWTPKAAPFPSTIPGPGLRVHPITPSLPR
jgi:phytoene dehydrogenase-like protein